MRALVIDDSRVARAVLRNALLPAGFEVHEAVDGSDALEKLEGMDMPDIAFVDWNMPRINGLEFVREVRKNARYDEMLLMMVTSETETRQMVRALNAGANEYLMKPFTNDVLVAKLELLGVAGSYV